MKKIEFNKQEIIIPTSWADITLGEYEKLEQSDYLDCIASICKIPTQELSKIPTNVLDEIKELLKFLFDGNSEREAVTMINGEAFSITPKGGLIVAELLELDSINDREELLLSDILAVVCRPIGDKYNKELLFERSKLFKQQSCELMLPLINFFLYQDQQSRELLNLTLQTIENANQFLSDIKEFESNGDGVKRLPIWQRMKYSSLTKSLEKQLEKYSYQIE